MSRSKSQSVAFSSSFSSPGGLVKDMPSKDACSSASGDSCPCSPPEKKKVKTNGTRSNKTQQNSLQGFAWFASAPVRGVQGGTGVRFKGRTHSILASRFGTHDSKLCLLKRNSRQLLARLIQVADTSLLGSPLQESLQISLIDTLGKCKSSMHIPFRTTKGRPRSSGCLNCLHDIEASARTGQKQKLTFLYQQGIEVGESELAKHRRSSVGAVNFTNLPQRSRIVPFERSMLNQSFNNPKIAWGLRAVGS